MPENKTQPTDADVGAFLQAVEHPGRREDGMRLRDIFDEVTGWRPVMWGPSIVGYGCYDYTTRAGQHEQFLATGFSPRKANLSLYIMPGYQNYADILGRLGKHKTGAACLYITRLRAVDEAVLRELIARGLADLEAKGYPVSPS